MTDNPPIAEPASFPVDCVLGDLYSRNSISSSSARLDENIISRDGNCRIHSTRETGKQENLK